MRDPRATCRVGFTENHQEGSTITKIDDAWMSDPDVERHRVRRRRPKPKRSKWLSWAGYGMIVAGLAVLAWVAWQFWGTNWVSERRQEKVAEELHDAWADGNDSVRTDFGRASAILHVPRWDEGKDDYAIPVLEGSTDEVLAAGIGHMEDTAEPGEVGNYVIAGHRVTHGEPFAKFPELKEGDEVYVETRTATYVYELIMDGTDLEVPFTEDWVIQPFPKNPDGGIEPPKDLGQGESDVGDGSSGSDGARLITLVSCAEIFHTDMRSVVWGYLVEVIPGDQ